MRLEPTLVVTDETALVWVIKLITKLHGFQEVYIDWINGFSDCESRQGPISYLELSIGFMYPSLGFWLLMNWDSVR